MAIQRTNVGRSMARTAQAGKREGGGRRGGNRLWRQRWTPNETPTRVHFGIPETLYENFGNMDPWKIGFQHWVPGVGKGKGRFIDCGSPDAPCLVCAYTDPQSLGLDVEINTSMAKCYRDMYIGVAGWIEEWFHMVPVKKDGKEYKNRVMCEKRGCQYCKEGHIKIFGTRFYTQFSYPQWRAVFEPLEQQVQTHCQCGGRLAVFDYLCANCETPLVDFLTTCAQCGGENISVDFDQDVAMCEDCSAEWSIFEYADAELVNTVRNDVKCPECGHNDILVPRLGCAMPGEGCGEEPNPYSIFDVSMVLQKKDKRLEVLKWNIAEPNEKLFDPEHQGPDKEIAEKVAKRNEQVIDLNEVFETMSASEQSALLGLENPWSTSNAGGKAKYYKGPKVDGVGDEGDDDDYGDY